MKLNQKLFSVSIFCGLGFAREFILPQRQTELQQNNLPVPWIFFDCRGRSGGCLR